MATSGQPATGTTRDDPPSRNLATWEVVLLAVVLVALGLTYLGGTMWAWQLSERAAAADAAALPSPGTEPTQPAGATPATVEVDLLGWDAHLTAETTIFVLVVAASGLGSFVHAGTSFVSYVGNGTLRRTWVAWYLFRSIIGASLAMIFYVVFRAGFLTADANSASVNRFGVVSLAGLAGMFSKQATDKLREIFDTLFTKAGDVSRKDKLEAPAITALQPATARAGAPGLEIDVIGHGFDPGTVGEVDGEARETTVRTDRELTVALLPSDLESPGQLAITVRTSTGTRTAPAIFTVSEPTST